MGFSTILAKVEADQAVALRQVRAILARIGPVARGQPASLHLQSPRDFGATNIYIFMASDCPDKWQVSYSDWRGEPVGHEYRSNLYNAIASVVGLYLDGQDMPLGHCSDGYILVDFKVRKPE